MFEVKLHSAQTLRDWFEQYLLDRIDMNPAYQRKASIWSPWKRAHLIDSILNDFDIPKFYVAVSFGGTSSSMNKSQKAYAIIDGKQRFQALFDFFSDKVNLNKSFILEADPSIQMAGMNYSDLKMKYPFYAKKFDNFLPAVMDVLTDEPHKIDELFVRLNSGESANSAEKRNAKQGPVPEIIRELTLHPFFQRNVSFNTTRMQEYALASKLFMIEMREAFVDTKAKVMDDFSDAAYKWSVENSQLLNTAADPYSTARDRVYDVLDRLAREFNQNDPLLATQGNIPIYYWFARHHPKQTNELRDFVEELTRSIKENLKIERLDPQQSDRELMSFYTMSRSTNDQASLEGRYKIFTKRFKDFRNPLLKTVRR